jgi:hypothetical protein
LDLFTCVHFGRRTLAQKPGEFDDCLLQHAVSLSLPAALARSHRNITFARVFLLIISITWCIYLFNIKTKFILWRDSRLTGKPDPSQIARSIGFSLLEMLVDKDLGFVPLPATDSNLTGFMTSSRYSNEIYSDSSSGICASIWHGGFPEEPSLFEELGIHNTDVVNNFKIILLPMSEVRTVGDNFILGMLIFCCFAASLLLLG